MAKFIVSVPFKGVQTYLVEARSAAEAKRNLSVVPTKTTGSNLWIITLSTRTSPATLFSMASSRRAGHD